MKKNPTDLIRVSGSIEVQQDCTAAFRYLSDLRLDKTWREEIIHTTLSPETIGPGTVATEESFLSKKVPNHKAVLTCTEFMPGNHVVFESLPENRFRLKSSREVAALPDGKTRIDYAVEFDPAVVKYGLGFSLPRFFIRYYTKTTLQQYLKQLKRILEAAR